MHKIGVRTGRRQSRSQSRFQHVAGAPRIFSDYDSCPPVLAVQPPQIPSDLKGMVRCKIFIGFAAEAVRSKIF